MNCSQLNILLAKLLTNDLTDEQIQKLKQLLKNCPEKQANAQLIKKLILYSKSETIAKPNPFLWTRIQAKISTQPVLSIWKLLQPALATAIVIIGIWLGILIGNIFNQTILEKQQPINEYELFIPTDQLDNSYFLTDAKIFENGNN